MRSDDEEALRSFVATRYPYLRRTAFLLCGDWAAADELTGTTLARLVGDCRRGNVEDPDAYAWSELMRPLTHRPGRREHVFVAAPDSGGGDPATVLVLDALHRLAPRCRGVLVLRHWDGLSVEEVADVLGLADDRVTAYETAGLGALEMLLGTTEPAATR